jgi:hypothetical protein
LFESAVHKGANSQFIEGPLSGRSVNIKWYAKQEGLLDINPNALPNDYLVPAGLKGSAVSSRGKTRPWLIDSVFRFDAHALHQELLSRGVRIGVATSVRQHLWEKAEIYPRSRNGRLVLTDRQREVLARFG